MYNISILGKYGIKELLTMNNDIFVQTIVLLYLQSKIAFQCLMFDSHFLIPTFLCWYAI